MRFIAIAIALCVSAPFVAAQSATLVATSDNTLFESPTGALSSGVGDSVYAGRTGVLNNFLLRRGLMAFDIAGAIPAGSTVTSVSLTLNTIQAQGVPATFNLHRVSANWGEGTSNSSAGGGAPATPGDATWIHTFSPSSLWTAPGGDFTVAASGSTSVGTTAGPYTWSSTPQLVADVQGWLDSPATNFGWLIKTDELVNQTAARFASREHPIMTLRPSLSVMYVPVPEPTGILVLAAGAIAAWKVRRWRME